MGEYITSDGLRLVNVHEPERCKGQPCVIHNPTKNAMSDWPLIWRDDRVPGIFERICPHGIGHPDIDQRVFWRETNQEWLGVHGCDGCCAEWNKEEA